MSGYFHLSASTIDNEELWKWLALFGESFVAAEDYFCHGCVVVGSFDGLDIEFAIFFAIGFAIGEAHHGGNGVGTLDVGVIKALDVDGQHGELEGFLDAF